MNVKLEQYIKFFNSHRLNEAHTQRSLIEAVEYLLRAFRSDREDQEIAHALLGAMRYRNIVRGIYEKLSSEELSVVLKTHLRHPQYQNYSMYQITDLLASDVSKKAYDLFSIAAKDADLRSAIDQMKVNCIYRMLLLESVFNPENVLNMFDEFWTEVRPNEGTRLNSRSFTRFILPNIYKEREKLEALIALQPFNSSYIEFIEKTKGAAFNILLAEYRFGYIKDYIDGREALRYMSSREVFLIMKASEEELGTLPGLPFQMYFELIKIRIAEVESIGNLD